MSNDTVKILIGDQFFSGWESLTITRAVDSMADAFSFSAAYNEESTEFLNNFKPFKYQECKIYIDETLIITGRIESIGATLAQNDRVLNIQGRSLPGVLIDCSIDIGKFQFNGLKFSAIAAEVCKPFKISVNAENDTETLEESRAEPGAKCYEFLNKIAKDSGLLLKSSAAGELVIIKLNPAAAPIANLEEGSAPIMEISAEYNGAGRFSSYKVFTQQDAENAQGEALDNGIPLNRPSVSVGTDTEASKIKDAAEWRRALALAASFSLSVKLSGWRGPGGNIWEPGQLITLKSKSVFLNKSTSYIIAEAVQNLDGSGRVTSLRLVLPATYSGKIPGVIPWE